MVHGAKIGLFQQGGVLYFCMMIKAEVHTYLVSRLRTIYDESEADAIACLLGERIAGGRTAYRVFRGQTTPLEEKQTALLAQWLDELLAHKPVQYVLHEAWFYGLKFYVDENVLIPRPETDELAHWVVADVQQIHARGSDQRILDLCTGSGCIALAVKMQLPDAVVSGCDLSDAALQVARKNAVLLRLDVDFFTHDVLDENDPLPMNSYAVIISNPPYISWEEAETLPMNVREYEPAMALFAHQDDPLIFYRRLAVMGMQYLERGGVLYCEVHVLHARDVEALFWAAGYTDITVREDLQRKPRMVRAKRPG